MIGKHEEVEIVRQYSQYYEDMIAISARLHNDNEDYAAMLILFNDLELIFKSKREN